MAQTYSLQEQTEFTMRRAAQKVEAAADIVNERPGASDHDEALMVAISLVYDTVDCLREELRHLQERDQRVATALDALAEKITYLSTSSREVREKVHDLAAIIRDEQ